MFGLHLLSPWWLLALALLPLAAWHGRRSLAGLSGFRRWTSLILRMILIAAAVLALAEACWKQISREVTTVYLLDRSASIPRKEWSDALNYVRDTSGRREEGGRKVDDRAGLVVFGEGASVELAPSERFYTPQRLHSMVDPGHTDLAEGLRMAAASFPAGARKRIVLISDGAETKGLGLAEARRLAEMGIRVECLPIERRATPEVMVERLVVRSEARQGEPVQVRAIIKSNGPASGELELLLDGRPVGKPRRFRIEKGGKLHPETFEVKLTGPGFYPLEVRLRPDGGCDTVDENNVGHAFTQIKGEARVLIVYSPVGKKNGKADVESLRAALRSEKIEVKLAGPAAIPASNAELAGYDCVIIANVGAYAFTKKGMEAVRAAVRDMGVGLIMIGGPDSFGAGGYLNTPIEEALPVSCDVRQRKVMPNGALVLVMHTCEMPQPNYWGRRISQAAIDALSDQDEAGLLLYDWNKGCSWLFKLQLVGPNRAKISRLIKTAQPGDMPDFDSSMKMALAGLKGAKAALKHCIIISDGDPSLSDATLPGQFKRAKITISTIAIAPHGGMSVGTLKRIAKATGGRYYYPKSPNLLPQIFVKEAMTVRRSVIFKQTFTPRLALVTDPLKGFQGVKLPQLDGYVVTTAKARAEVPLTVTLGKEAMTDPVLAHWRYGEGKATAFTSTAAADWASNWISWPGYVKFWSQVVRWTSRAGASGDLQVRSEIRNGVGRVVVEAIDDKGRLINFLDLKGHVVGPRNKGQSFDLVQTAPGRYQAEYQAGPAGAYQVNVVYKDSAGRNRHHITGASSGYSPEYARLESNRELLEEIARATGGEVLSGNAAEDRPKIWARNLPPGHRVHPGWQWLLWIILILFPLDVAVRRLMIDWRALAARARAIAGLIVPKLRPAVATGPDPTMAALMAEKQRLRESAPAPQSKNVRSRFLEQLHKAPDGASAEEGDALAEMLRRHKATRKTEDLKITKAAGKKPPAGPKPTGISGYAGALLDAKKRALKEKDQDQDKQKG